MWFIYIVVCHLGHRIHTNYRQATIVTNNNNNNKHQEIPPPAPHNYCIINNSMTTTSSSSSSSTHKSLQQSQILRDFYATRKTDNGVVEDGCRWAVVASCPIQDLLPGSPIVCPTTMMRTMKTASSTRIQHIATASMVCFAPLTATERPCNHRPHHPSLCRPEGWNIDWGGPWRW